MTRATPDISVLHSDLVAPAAELLAAALHDDPGWTHVVPDPGRRRTALTGLIAVALRDALPFRHIYATRDGSRLSGVAVWLPPGGYPMTTLRQARAAPAIAALALRIPRDIRNLARFGAGIDGAFPPEPVWYLQILGVHPDLQRRGFGQQLLRPILAESGRTGVPCYLETAEPANVPYYEHAGFSVIGHPGPLSAGGPPMVRMIRPSDALG